MANFEASYTSNLSQEELWQVTNTPLLNPNIASQIHDDLIVSYDNLGIDGQIGLGTGITYAAGDEAIENVAPVYRRFIPKDVTLFVARMTPHFEEGQALLRHDVLISSKATGSVTRTVEPEGPNSRLIVEATLTLNGLANMFESEITRALAHTMGISSERMVSLAEEILDV